MGEIYPIGQTCQYMINRAARHRRAGRYDQAITLLSRARGQFGQVESLDYELARTYDEMGCEDEACRFYLRTVLSGGKHTAKALFQLALTSAKSAELDRAVSYFEAFLLSDREGVSPECCELLRRQLFIAIQRKPARTRRQRAKALEQRAVQRLQEGKFNAAKRTICRSLRFNETAQGYALKACCHLVQGDGDAAVQAADKALHIRPRYIQAKCILADAYMMINQPDAAKKLVIQAAVHARSSVALLNIAIACAKYGYDELTLILTARLLKRDPFHIQALALRACALTNLGSYASARRLFRRLCALLPDNSVFSAYEYALSDARIPDERLSLAQDVTQSEAIDRCVKLVSMIHEDPDEMRGDPTRIRQACRLADWAMHSVLAGSNITTMAIIILSVLNTPETRQVLYDALVDKGLDDSLKYSIFRALASQCDELPTYADLGGKFVRLAAGIIMPTIKRVEDCQSVVQAAAQSLVRYYPDAAEILLGIWARYVARYGTVKGKTARACAAALEYVYHLKNGRYVDMRRIAERTGASGRLAMLCVRRMIRLEETPNEERYVKRRKIHEVHQF